MNAVARTQSKFQMSALLQNIYAIISTLAHLTVLVKDTLAIQENQWHSAVKET